MLRQGFGLKSGDTTENGAATSIQLAVSEEVATTTGRYFVGTREAKVAPQAEKEGIRRALSAKRVGLAY